MLKFKLIAVFRNVGNLNVDHFFKNEHTEHTEHSNKNEKKKIFFLYKIIPKLSNIFFVVCIKKYMKIVLFTYMYFICICLYLLVLGVFGVFGVCSV